MKLFTSDASPYGRKVRIVIAEKGLGDRIQTIDQSPFAADVTALREANPLGKIPALVSRHGATLYDSRVICEYLDGLLPSPRLIPDSGPARIDVLRRQALADGVMDAAFNLRMERVRPEALRSAEWMTRWEGNIRRGIAAMQADVREAFDPNNFDLGAIAGAAAIGYVEFRLGDIDWRGNAPEVELWWSRVRERASVKSTAPK